MTTIANRWVLRLALTLLLAVGVAHAKDGAGDDEADHERARHALEGGSIRPLAEILATVRNRIEGDVVGVEFEYFDGRYVYELKVITPAGFLREVQVDATTAEIMTSGDD